MSDLPLYNPNDGLYGRGSNAGGYLDQKQAEEAEILRAKIEGREPDLDNPGAYAGIQLQTAAQMIANRATDVNRVGQTGFALPGEDVFKQSVDSPDTPLKAVDKIPAVAFSDAGLAVAEDEVIDEEPSDPNLFDTPSDENK